MHNRASVKGIAVMLEDSTSDTSKAKAFKSLSTMLTSFLLDIVRSVSF
jgi:hypothetical protein